MRMGAGSGIGFSLGVKVAGWGKSDQGPKNKAGFIFGPGRPAKPGREPLDVCCLWNAPACVAGKIKAGVVLRPENSENSVMLV